MLMVKAIKKNLNKHKYKNVCFIDLNKCIDNATQHSISFE